MKLLFEFFPIVLFFVVFKFKGIYFATAAAIAASIIQIVFALLKKKKIDPPMWIGLCVLVVFGGFTLIFHNEMFIKWKPTILYWLFAVIIIAAKAGFNRNVIRILLERQLQVPDKVWNTLAISWAAFFALVGAINLFVAYHFSTAAWVNFKLFGIMGFMLVFIIVQTIILAPHLPKQEK